MKNDLPVGQAAPRPQAATSFAAPGHFALARLLQIVTLLQTERCPNARMLAEACEVSRRTIYRDFSTIAAAGIAGAATSGPPTLTSSGVNELVNSCGRT